jgi:hypothetical protein
LRIKAYRFARFREKFLSLPAVKAPLCTNNKIMRLTKIYFKKVRVFFAFGAGLFSAFLLCFCLYVFFLKPANNLKKPLVVSKSDSVISDYEKQLQNAKLFSVDYLPGVGYVFKVLMNEKIVSSYELASKGFVVVSRNKNDSVTFKSKSSGGVFIITR